MSKRSKLSIVAVMSLMAFALFSGANVRAADPVEDLVELATDLTTCSMWADEPGGNPVTGTGGARACGPNQTIAIVVCLDYNGVTVATSCKPKTGTGSVSARTNPTPCLPGLWQTQVTANTPGPDMKVLSDPVLLLCLPPTGGVI